VPDKVKVEVQDNHVHVEGPKGKLDQQFDRTVTVKLDGGTVTVTPVDESAQADAMQGTARSIINNMIHGVINGYEKNIEIHGVGFRAALKGKILDLALGFSHPVEFPIPDGITVTVAENTKVKVEGADKQLVGQVAASIKSFRPVEPYKGKGVRIVGEYVRRKEGKKAG
jgi:large subunit ribosomal protein L6